MIEAKTYMTLSNPSILEFFPQGDGVSPKATLEIKNVQEVSNLAYKIKTTAPKLFVVKPIQGILAAGRTVFIEIQLQMKELKSSQDIHKHKFMVQGTPCDLQASENFKLTKFWEQKTDSKDKTHLQQVILKINMDALEGEKERATIAMKKETPIGYEKKPDESNARATMGSDRMQSFAQDANKYEKAPGEDINNDT